MENLRLFLHKKENILLLLLKVKNGYLVLYSFFNSFEGRPIHIQYGYTYENIPNIEWNIFSINEYKHAISNLNLTNKLFKI